MQNDSSSTIAVTTTAGPSYDAPLLGRRWGSVNRYPLYDRMGTARRLVDQGGDVDFTYDIDVFGCYQSEFEGARVNPYRFGGAWGYMTDPSGLQQLGATRSAALRAWVLLAGAWPVHLAGPDRGWGELVCLCREQSGGVGGSGGVA